MEDYHMKYSLKLEIATPKGVFRGAFDKTTKVSEVIETVVNEMELDGGDSFQLAHGGTVLEPQERPLVSFGIECGSQLELIATGSGV